MLFKPRRMGRDYHSNFPERGDQSKCSNLHLKKKSSHHKMSKKLSNAEALFPSDDESSSEIETSHQKQSQSSPAPSTSAKPTQPSAGKSSHRKTPKKSSCAVELPLSDGETSSELEARKKKRSHPVEVVASTEKPSCSKTHKKSSNTPSDDESSSEAEAKKKKRSHTEAVASTSSAGRNKKVKINPVTKPRGVTAMELFGSDSEDEEPNNTPAPPGKLLSYITRRLSNGVSRQTNPTKSGSHYVELKVYKCDEIEKVSPINRWRQAIVTIKNQTDDTTDAWQHLANFIIATRKEFRKFPCTFVSNYY